jgi:Cytochrome c7 and related cytochrome c/Class III cytochrome C family
MQVRVREVLAGLIVSIAATLLPAVWPGIGAAPAGAQTPIAPPVKQPILFSHKIHAGDFKIDCQYCHADARRSSYAGLPSVKRCMGCHQIVASKDPELQKEVEKLRALSKDGKPVEWARIHKVPGFVYFSHKPHVQQGLACQQCHGQIQTMSEVAQVAPLTMGWCVSCHAERKGPLECVVCHH